MRLSNRAILLFIISVAIILRFYQFLEIPFMHDEFSAVFRTDFRSFQELIEKGIKPDGHPAGIQVFLFYWIKLFGSTEWVVKLPFAIMGVLSILLIFLIAKRWYNETVGLISAAFFTSLQYTVMYSQIARPYISGLFFSLLMVYYWSIIMDPNVKNFWKNASLYVLASALCAYNHHFSLLFAAIVGLSGILFIFRKFMVRYILCGIMIFILYIPHLGIFMNQFKTGGVGGWLAKPEHLFLLDYMYYIFNYSFFSVFLAIGLIFFGLLNLKKASFRLSNFLLLISWFLIPFLIGYLYSLKVNAVLQFSVLIFSFYTLLFIIFSHISKQNTKINLILVLVILAVNSYSLIYERKHYSIFYNSSFERIVTDFIRTGENYNNVAQVIHSHKKITNYYLKKYNADSTFIWFDSFMDEAEFISFLENKSKTANCLYLGALSSIKPNTIPIIKHYFPVIEMQNNYFLGSTYLFSKSGHQRSEFVTNYGFDTPAPEGWGVVNHEKIIKNEGSNNSYSYLMDSLTEWSPTFATPVGRLITHENNFIDVSVSLKPGGEMAEVLLITTLESKDGIQHFSGADFNDFITSPINTGEWKTVYHSMKLSDINLNYSNLILNVYVWNKGKKSFLIDDFRISIREGNPLIYSLYEKIP